MAKKKKLLKKLAKAALIGGGLYAATRGLKGRADKLTEGNIGAGLSAPIVDDYNYTPKVIKKPKWTMPDDPKKWEVYQAKGGRVGKKGGGIAKRGMGAAYKSGGRVKSMGIAKRGGGVAKR